MGRKIFILAGVLAIIGGIVIFLFWENALDQHRPVGVASAFLESYYVVVDLEKARVFTEGRAKTKIDRQLRETQNMSRAVKNQSMVSYRLLMERSLGEGRKAFSFELSIEPQGGKVFQRMVFLNLRRDQQKWRVHSFQEHSPS
jgi:hypothetical protein